MTNEQLRVAMAELEGIANQWVLMKRGLYYRPNGHGYTNNIQEAWLLAEHDADKHVYPHDEPVTKHHAPLPDYPNDLNAVHRVLEKVCADYTVEIIFAGGVWKVVRRWLEISVVNKSLAHALCEFCLRVTNKWRDEKMSNEPCKQAVECAKLLFINGENQDDAAIKIDQACKSYAEEKNAELQRKVTSLEKIILHKDYDSQKDKRIAELEARAAVLEQIFESTPWLWARHPKYERDQYGQRFLAAFNGLREALHNAERYMTEKGVSHEHPVLIDTRKALEAAKEFKI